MSDNVLTGKQLAAIDAMLAGRSRSDSANAARVSERTLTRWLHDKNFTHHLRDAEALVIGEAVSRLATLTRSACDALQKVFDDPEAAPALKLRAAQITLDAALHLRADVVFEDRLRELEEWQVKTNAIRQAN